MKLKNMWKRFWTLDVHNHEGFTLVELIIVIAILAILSTGAIAGYSAYVESANKTTDKALIAEIENVLLMAYYSGTISQTDVGTIVLTADGIQNVDEIEGTPIGTALADAYGEGWKSLKLNYDSWNLMDDSSLIAYINKSNQFNSDKETMTSLLTTLQHVTDQFAGWLGDGENISDQLKDYLKDNNIMYAGDKQAASNATVMYVGNLVSQADSSEFVEYWGDPSSVYSDPIIAKAVEYASTLALLKYIDSEAGLTGDASYANQLASAEGLDLINKMPEIMNQVSNNGHAFYIESYTDDSNGESESQKDAMAFLAYMKGLTSVKDSLLQNMDISSKEFYSDGTILSTLQNYAGAGAVIDSHGVTNGVVISIANGIITHIGAAD